MGMERGTTAVHTNSNEAEAGIRRFGPVAKLPAKPILNELSADDRKLVKRRVTEPVECMFDPSFLDPASEQQLRRAWHGPEAGANTSNNNKNDDSGLNLLETPDDEVPTVADERHKFLWLNYCRFRVQQIIAEHSGVRLSEKAVAELLRWEHAADQARNDLVRENIPLVLAMAKRARLTRVDFADLVSEGNLALMRAVDKFDINRGFKFSTYACRAILKSFSRVATRTARYRGRFPTEFDPALEKGDSLELKHAEAHQDSATELRSIVERNLAELTDVEVKVIRARFALENEAAANGTTNGNKTLEQVGTMIGVTKERVRQIQNKALGKLREYLEDEFLAG